MIVPYCDLCGSPIKSTKWRLQYTKYTVDDENNPLRGTFSQQCTEKDMCRTCKDIIDQIFKHRMTGILKLASDLKTIYELPTKTPKPTDGRKRNKKKKP